MTTDQSYEEILEALDRAYTEAKTLHEEAALKAFAAFEAYKKAREAYFEAERE